MESNNKCKNCGSNEIGKGKLGGYANMYRADGNVFSSGSPINADICTDCGQILSLRVENPEMFIKK